jgi:predicted nucleic acid-binding protein
MSRIAVDTNILLRVAVPNHPLHTITVAAVEQLQLADHELVIFPQMVYEFWSVGTKTAIANGLGYTAAIVGGLIDHFLDDMLLIYDDQAVFDRWQQLVRQHGVSGVNSYDARIAAATLAHGIPTLLTWNKSDFKRYAGIDILTPEQVVAVPRGGQ